MRNRIPPVLCCLALAGGAGAPAAATSRRSVEPRSRASASEGEGRVPTIRLSQGALRRRAVRCKAPDYPAHRGMRVKGAVTVEIVFDTDGTVLSAAAVEGHPLFRPDALRAALGWTFKPLRVKGKAARATGLLAVFFTWDRGEAASQCRGLRPVV